MALYVDSAILTPSPLTNPIRSPCSTMTSVVASCDWHIASASSGSPGTRLKFDTEVRWYTISLIPGRNTAICKFVDAIGAACPPKHTSHRATTPLHSAGLLTSTHSLSALANSTMLFVCAVSAPTVHWPCSNGRGANEVPGLLGKTGGGGRGRGRGRGRSRPVGLVAFAVAVGDTTGGEDPPRDCDFEPPNACS